MPANEARYKDDETITLGDDEYFFVGDNVEHSNDSRLSGPTRGSSLVGVVDLIYWPLRSSADCALNTRAGNAPHFLTKSRPTWLMTGMPGDYPWKHPSTRQPGGFTGWRPIEW